MERVPWQAVCQEKGRNLTALKGLTFKHLLCETDKEKELESSERGKTGNLHIWEINNICLNSPWIETIKAKGKDKRKGKHNTHKLGVGTNCSPGSLEQGALTATSQVQPPKDQREKIKQPQ